MFWGILHRTIFWELFKVFFLALVGLNGLVLMAGVVAEASRNGLGPAQILTIIPLLLPSMLPYTLPTTTLFATCVVYGRLAADSEILAIKAAGVHIVHVLWPAVLLGVDSTALTLFLYMETIPITHFLLKSEIAGNLEDLVYGMLRKEGCLRHPKMNYTIFVREMQGQKLRNATFMRKDPHGSGYDMVAVAREAELLFDLSHRQILVHMRDCHVATKNQAALFFQDKVWPVELPDDVGTFSKLRATDMTWRELQDQRQSFEDQKAKFSQEIEAHQSLVNLNQAPPNFPNHIQHLQNERKYRDLLIASIDAEVHMRPAFALSCLCFVLVGCPVGIWFSRSDYLSAFITCFLPVVVVYYPLMLCTINLAKSGKLQPWLGIWIADALMILVGTFLFRRLART